MNVTETFTDPIGSETLDVIARANRFNKWMFSTIQPFCQGNILEIGSGVGNISTYFIQKGSDIFLSDIREEYCNLLKRKFAHHLHVTGVEQIDLVHPDFDKVYAHLTEKFDTVFALNVLEHIEDHNQAILNARKLLKPSGKLIILVPAYPFLYCRFDKELGHYRRYTRKSLHKVISENHLKSEKIFHFNVAGIGAWFLFGKLSGRRQIEQNEMGLFNHLVPLFKLIDRVSFHKTGLSVIIVATKTNP